MRENSQIASYTFQENASSLSLFTHIMRKISAPLREDFELICFLLYIVTHNVKGKKISACSYFEIFTNLSHFISSFNLVYHVDFNCSHSS